MARKFGSVQIRPRNPGDDARIVDLLGRYDPGGPPVLVETYAEAAAKDKAIRLVADGDGALVGHGLLDPAWWTGLSGAYLVHVLVDAVFRRQGIGDALYQTVLRRQPTPIVQLVTWVREDDEMALHFAEHRGFRPGGEVLEESCLDVRTARVEAGEDIEERLRRDGIVILALSEIERDDAFLRALQRLWGEPGGDKNPLSREQWVREVLEGPGLSPESHWVAVLERQPIGMTFLKRLAPTSAENDYTGVAAAYQGRGIARALKLRAITWAQRQRIRFLYTSNATNNLRMLEINRRLGYRPISRKVEMLWRLESED